MYSKFESNKEFFRRYLLLFPFAFYAAYNILFVKKNKQSRKAEWQLVSPSFERYVVAPRINSIVMERANGKIYKQDTEETKLV